MPKLSSNLLLLLMFSLAGKQATGNTQSPAEKDKIQEKPKNPVTDGKTTPPLEPPEPEGPPSLSEKEKEEICRKFNGKHISFYDRVFHVSGCKRYELTPRKTYELTRKGTVPLEVDSRVIDGLQFAGREKSVQKESLPLCKRYHHKYVTYAYVDVYWVEGCVKHPFPDWSSYEVHAGKLRNDRPDLKPIDPDDFHALTTGEPMKSIIDEEFREVLEDQTEQADLLPLDEACRGIIGSHVTYLGDIFYISRVPGKKGSGDFCERQTVDSEEFTRREGIKGFRLRELSSSQALSIPAGSPALNKKNPG